MNNKHGSQPHPSMQQDPLTNQPELILAIRTPPSMTPSTSCPPATADTKSESSIYPQKAVLTTAAAMKARLRRHWAHIFRNDKGSRKASHTRARMGARMDDEDDWLDYQEQSLLNYPQTGYLTDLRPPPTSNMIADAANYLAMQRRRVMLVRLAKGMSMSQPGEAVTTQRRKPGHRRTKQRGERNRSSRKIKGRR